MSCSGHNPVMWQSKYAEQSYISNIEHPTNAPQVFGIPIETIFVLRCLRTLKKDKYPGPDGIPILTAVTIKGQLLAVVDKH